MTMTVMKVIMMMMVMVTVTMVTMMLVMRVAVMMAGTSVCAGLAVCHLVPNPFHASSRPPHGTEALTTPM